MIVYQKVDGVLVSWIGWEIDNECTNETRIIRSRLRGSSYTVWIFFLRINIYKLSVRTVTKTLAVYKIQEMLQNLEPV